MDRGGAWPFFVRRVICLVPPVSVCTWKKKREEKRKRKEEREKDKIEKEKEKRGKRKRRKRKREREKNKLKKNHKTPKKPLDELSHHDSKKKKTRPDGIIWHFFFESSESHLLELILESIFGRTVEVRGKM